jgi:antitoxin YqcF
VKKPISVELAGACDSKFADSFFTILGSAAFCMIRAEQLLSPGDCLPGYVAEYHKSAMEHLYFTAPFLWEEHLSSMELPDRKVLWLMAIPISEAEREYLIEHEDEKFEQLLQSHDTDFYDLDRRSII